MHERSSWIQHPLAKTLNSGEFRDCDDSGENLMLAADAIEAPDWVAIPLAATMLTIVGVLYWRGERYRQRTQEAIRAWAQHNNHILCAAHMNKLRRMRFDSRDRDSILYIEIDQGGSIVPAG